MKLAIQKALKQGFKAFGDIREQVIYHTLGTVTYDSTTGSTVEVGGIDTTLSVIPARYSQKEIDGIGILPSDIKMLFPASGYAITPTSEGDYITRGAEIWNVKSVFQDPVKALWICQLRRKT